jgi:hypothetical protein
MRRKPRNSTSTTQDYVLKQLHILRVRRILYLAAGWSGFWRTGVDDDILHAVPGGTRFLTRDLTRIVAKIADLSAAAHDRRASASHTV